MVQPANPAQPFLDALHADKPLRVWSLIVTIFGDVVMRRGVELSPPPLWTGHLLLLLEKLGVDAGLVRTSLSRLVANGVLLRDKQGRNTFYRLSETSCQEFAAAAALIYGEASEEPEGQLQLALTDRVADRASARDQLEAVGFRFLSATTALRPTNARDFPHADLPGLMLANVEAEGNFAAAIRELWFVDLLQAGYRNFVERFSAIDPGLAPDDAIVARIVAVHRMRRLILKDPQLPLSALPADWAGGRARALFAHHLQEWQAPSELWLEQAGFWG